jgi:anti-sigma-K factor RskA
MNTTTRNDRHIDADDLVLLALQFLPADQLAGALAHLERCAECRTELAQLQGDLAAVAITAEPAAPSAEAKSRLMRQIAKEPKLAPPEPRQATAAAAVSAEPMLNARNSRVLAMDREEHERPRTRKLPWVIAWTGWAVAAGASFFAGLQLHQRQAVQTVVADQQARLDENAVQAAQAERAKDVLRTLTSANAQQVALHLPATGAAAKLPPKPEALAAYIADKGALVFIATHLQPVGPGKTYELWLLPADPKGTPIPAGTFKPDTTGNASVVLPRLPAGVAAKGFGVTVEKDGGSPTPTLPIVLSGA